MGTSTLPDRDVKLLIPFTEIYLGRGGFHVLAMLKTKQRFRLQAGNNFETEAEYDFFQQSFSLKITSL